MSMGFYIKGMEMPESCDNCWALDDYGDYPRCRITEEQRGYNFPIRDKRMNKCPLIPVPPHGRLIDADALINALQELFDRRNKDAEYMGFRGATVSWNDAICYIKDAPIIIEAEE